MLSWGTYNIIVCFAVNVIILYLFNKKIVDYLKFARDFAKICPGFETDIHGLVEVEGTDGVVRYYADCVAA